MPVQFSISAVIPANAETIYRAWLDSEMHGAMTGGKAVASSDENGSFSAWDGYITGRNILLEPYVRMVQSWRTTEFDVGDPDSTLEIRLRETDQSTLVDIVHSGLPENGMQYKQGWEEYYFEPMKKYFTELKNAKGV